MTVVTVLGAGGNTVSLNFTAQQNTTIAQQLAGAITAGNKSGALIAASDAPGAPPPVPAGKHGEFVQTKNGALFLPSGYQALVETAKNAVVSGSAETGQMILSGTATDLTFVAGGGSGTIAAAGSRNRIVANTPGAWRIDTGDGDDTIEATGGGANTISAGGGRNAIMLGSGSAVLASLGDDTVSVGGGAVTIDATAAKSDLVFGGGGSILFVGGAGGATILAGAGSVTYYGGAHGAGGGDDELEAEGCGGSGGGGGSGDDPKQYVQGGSAGKNYLFAGQGQATLFGGGPGDRLFAFGSVGQMLVGSAGASTLSGAFSSGANTIKGGAGDDLMIGGTGADTFVGGRGHDTVYATPGARDTFEFIKGQAGGTELIKGLFDAADVRIDLDGYSSKEVKAAIAGQTTSGGSVTLSLSDGTKVTFENIAALTSKNFV